MKKEFILPEFTVIKFVAGDIVTASTCQDEFDEYDCQGTDGYACCGYGGSSAGDMYH